jgi:FKBP-type peptidyl-prolyl cis-trans isomerase
MNRISQFISMAILSAILFSCGGASYQKTAGGMPYQLLRGKETQTAKAGEYLKLHLTQKINDSVYFTTGGKLPIYIAVGATPQPYDISELWTKLSPGDSLVTTQLMDTFLKRMPAGNLPPEFKKGDRIMTFVKVLGIISSDSLKIIDEQKENAAYAKKEAAEIEKLLGAKLSSVQRTPSGAYVEILQDGTGELVKAGNFVSLNYTGSTLEGKVFDSNTDSTFKHVEPLKFSVGAGQMIKGFDEALLLVKKGTKAKVYIPSSLGYGAAPPPGAPIKPYEHLIFDFTVLDVMDKAPAPTTPTAPAN